MAGLILRGLEGLTNDGGALDFGSLDTWATAQGLAAALAVGLLIGVERGWRDRDLAEGGRVAGLRTFSLVGLLGGALAVLLTEFGAWPLLGGWWVCRFCSQCRIVKAPGRRAT